MQAAARLRVPEAEGVIRGAADDPPVRQNGDAADPVAVSLQALQTAARLRVPEAEGAVIGAADDPPVRQDGDASDPVSVSLQALQAVARLRVPDPKGPVNGAADDPPGRQDGDASDPAAVSLQSLQAAARLRVPEAEGAVIGAAEDAPARQQGQAVHAVPVALELAEAGAGIRVPEAEPPVLRAAEQPPVGQSQQAGHRLGMARQDPDTAARGGVPEADVVIGGAAGHPAVRQHRQGPHRAAVAVVGKALPVQEGTGAVRRVPEQGGGVGALQPAGQAQAPEVHAGEAGGGEQGGVPLPQLQEVAAQGIVPAAAGGLPLLGQAAGLPEGPHRLRLSQLGGIVQQGVALELPPGLGDLPLPGHLRQIHEMQPRQAVPEVLVQEGVAGLPPLSSPASGPVGLGGLPVFRQQTQLLEEGLRLIEESRLRPLAGVQGPVVVEQGPQVAREGLGVQGLGRLLQQGQQLPLAQGEAVAPGHFIGRPGQEILAGRGAAQDPLLGFFPQQLPLEVVPDDAAGLIPGPGVQGIAPGRLLGQAVRLAVEGEKQGIDQEVPEPGLRRRQGPLRVPLQQTGLHRLPVQGSQAHGHRPFLQAVRQAEAVQGPGHGDQLGAGVVQPPAPQQLQQLQPLGGGDLVEAVQQQEQGGSLPGPGRQTADGVPPLRQPPGEIIRQVQAAALPVHQIKHRHVQGRHRRRPLRLIPHAEEGHGFADAALPLDDHAVVLRGGPGLADQLPHGAQLCLPAPAAPEGEVPELPYPGKELFIQGVLPHELEAGMLLPQLRQPPVQIGPQLLRGLGWGPGGFPGGVRASGSAPGGGFGPAHPVAPGLANLTIAQAFPGPGPELHLHFAAGLVPKVPAEAQVGIVVLPVPDAPGCHQVGDFRPLPVARLQANHLLLGVRLQLVPVSAEIGADVVQGKDGEQVPPQLLLQVKEAVVAQGQGGKALPHPPGLRGGGPVGVAALIAFGAAVRQQGGVQMQQVQPAPPAAQVGGGRAVPGVGGIAAQLRREGAVGPEGPQAAPEEFLLPPLQHLQVGFQVLLPVRVHPLQKGPQGRGIAHVMVAGDQEDVLLHLQPRLTHQALQKTHGPAVVRVPVIVEIPGEDQQLLPQGDVPELLRRLPEEQLLGAVGQGVFHKMQIGEMQKIHHGGHLPCLHSASIIVPLSPAVNKFRQVPAKRARPRGKQPRDRAGFK